VKNADHSSKRHRKEKSEKSVSDKETTSDDKPKKSHVVKSKDKADDDFLQGPTLAELKGLDLEVDSSTPSESTLRLRNVVVDDNKSKAELDVSELELSESSNAEFSATTNVMVMEGEKIHIARKQGMAIFLSRTLELTPIPFRLVTKRLRTLPENIVFLKLHRSPVAIIKDSRRFAAQAFPNDIYTLRIFIGFSETSLKLEDLVLQAVRDGYLPQIDLQDVIVFDAVETVQVVANRFYRRWPLYLYEQIKSAFPSPFSSGVVPIEERTLSLNIPCKI
jgi:hypothetical protein